MTAVDVAPSRRPLSRAASIVRNAWPVPVLVAAAVVAQQLLLNRRYDVGGHAAEHLTGASAPFMAAAVVGIVLWSTPAARRQVDVLIAAGLWLSATVFVMIGNPVGGRRPRRRRLLAHADELNSRRCRPRPRQRRAVVRRRRSSRTP